MRNHTTTPHSERPHIGFFGLRNAGKSSLLNALTAQNSAIVSPTPGSTTDPVHKAMELHPIGPIVFVDTAGLDDTEAELGQQRVKKTRQMLGLVDAAIILLTSDELSWHAATGWITLLKERSITPLVVLNKCDLLTQQEEDTLIYQIETHLQLPLLTLSSLTGQGINELKQALIQTLASRQEPLLVAHTLPSQALVLLVMPQDRQAPKGRLIQPQVQVLRELLDNHITAICTTPTALPHLLSQLIVKPDLVIIDSQIFQQISLLIPANWALTSFSILLAGRKGDLKQLLAGTEAIDLLQNGDKVLILESCTHEALKNDIGREQIPKALAKITGKTLHCDVVAGLDLPDNLHDYRLAVHCGGCMITRAMGLQRFAQLAEAGLAVTNYGLVLAKASGVLQKINPWGI
jgi:[FeFe] hydrogenase H-cluster maturation GTPase HydF